MLGYGRTATYDCSLCPPNTINTLRLSFSGVLIIAAVFYLTYDTKTSAVENSEQSILLKILMSNIQFNSLALSFNFQFPGFVSSVFSLMDTGSNVTVIMNVDCFIQGSSTVSPFFVKCTLMLAILGYFIVFPALVALGVAGYFKYKDIWSDKRKEWLLDWWVSCEVIVLFLLHPNVTSLAFSMFSCKALGNGPQNQYLLNDLSQQCYGAEHLFWIYRVSIPLLMFVIGIPVLGWCFLRFNLKYIREERSYPEESIRMKEKFGFLYNGYSVDRWFWEFMVVFRKVGLVMVSVFLVANVQVQALAALALCTIAIMFHVLFTPFSSVMMDLMEFFSLLSSFGTFFCGQFLFVHDLTENAYLTASVIILLLNFFFFVAFVYCFGSLMYAKCCKDKEADEFEAQQKKQAAALKRAQAETPTDIDDVTLKYRRPANEVNTLQQLEEEAAEKEKADRDKAAKAAADQNVFSQAIDKVGLTGLSGNLGFGLRDHEPTEEEKKAAQDERERRRVASRRASKRQRIKDDYNQLQTQNCNVM